jgi:UDP-N-acetylmuramate: L-alanyl-gamma-D-glutamyl-meso-diaminopimelate ligase
LGLKNSLYPEYLFDQTKDQKRIVVGKSHGKTTPTEMIIQVFLYEGIDFDYVTGSNNAGLETLFKFPDRFIISRTIDVIF